ncbi:MAG: hypothetical protein A3I44_05080 [Candidatus Sungbacteria bacterium RIFCSPLOWO2_02_FULL_51_17]|nr:MAG: hypothetical protein A2676_05195 [Candidatus Sungbacteria bacterium RIFCSPHIGHO2_01_FULL_51_22]OHA07017.1 MAG: hypothetical protein A3B29_01145 [Candidatus Sungbacteria bacterium RIFCSPLOWO2_01_FULL_51_34]OHA11791.1 MAG: hypothetical protein A3I44_05080 [Candidatus Sungbacteria bacterium RIFCSPLOWO2_02_FULL_51_17]
MSGEVKMVHPVVCQKWEESERGWGTRPDGYSLHLSDTDREAFIKDYWAGMPNAVPDEYSRPDGTPYVCDADSETYKKIKESKHGIWCHGRAPGSGGPDGWISRKS